MWGKGEVVPPLLPNFRGAVGENVCSPPIGTRRLLVRVATKMFLVKTEGFLQKPNMGRNTGVIICTMDSLYIPAGSRPSASARDPAIDTQGSEWAFLRWAKGGGDVVQPPVFRLPAGYAYSNAIPTMENDHGSKHPFITPVWSRDSVWQGGRGWFIGPGLVVRLRGEGL